MWGAYACRSILVLYLLCKNDLYFFNSNAKFSPRCSLDEWLWVVCPEWLCFGSRLRTFIILQVVLPVESFVKMYKLAINFSSETPFGETQNWGFKFSSIVYLLTACYLWFLLGNWLKINETAQELNKKHRALLPSPTSNLLPAICDGWQCISAPNVWLSPRQQLTSRWRGKTEWWVEGLGGDWIEL